MSHPELEELMAAWRAEPLPPARPPGLGREGPLAVVAALRQVAERRRRQRRFRKGAVALLMAAGVFGVALLGFREVLAPVARQVEAREPSISLESAVGEVVIIDSAGHVVKGGSLPEGYGVRTKQGTARLGFPSGARAEVSSRSSLEVTAARRSEALFLARGRVEVEVPKLGAERGFSVETPDARVTVHGTRFSVDVIAAPEGPRTRVGVTHGVVSVQHDGREVLLTAGQVWPPEEVQAEPALDAALEEGEAELAAPAPRKHRRKASRSRRPRREVVELSASELSEQNRGFARAMQLKKNGEQEAALQELTQLARRYPRSPLSQELRVERLRLLHGLEREREAARAARAYLRDFPDGYAEREAREILAEQP